MKNATQDILSRIGERIFEMPIEVLWRSLDLTARSGIRRSQSRGTDGFEIASRQEYELGDDPREIDHFATAQTGDDTIITVKFQEPRDINIVTLVDVGTTMQFGTRRVIKGELSAELVASILACSNKTQDRTKVITFSETAVESQHGPRGAKNNFAPALESILEPPDASVAASQSPRVFGSWKKFRASFSRAETIGGNAESVFESGIRQALQEVGGKKSLVFLVSDFSNLTSADRESLKDAARVHDLVCVVVQDERERELPSGRGFYTLLDIVSGETKTICLTETNRAKFRENASQKLDELCALFAEAECDWEVFSTEEDFDQVVPKMMRLFGRHRR